MIWMTRATAAEFCLRLCGFSPTAAERLAALRLRRERGEFREPTEAELRCFARWLVEHGRLSDWPRADDGAADAAAGAPYGSPRPLSLRR
jgi:hypothetical protein